MIEKKYHIYLNNKCLYHSLSIEDFDITWKMFSEFLTITDDRKKDILSYEEVIYSKETALNSSH
jgi:hypothetical protein